MKKSVFLSTLIVLCIVLITSCNTGKNEAVLQSGNDSLTKRITLLEDTLRQENVNKKLVADFYQQLFGDKDVSAIDKYIGSVYIQHNPALPDGPEALKEAATQWFKGAPKEKIDIQHIAADGDLVFIHLRANMGGKVNSVIDIFRIENGKISEHWDVIQEVPAKSANPHPMF
jgi:predicted SnoaL-like aldol condensation-catalyzing enzyme